MPHATGLKDCDCCTGEGGYMIWNERLWLPEECPCCGSQPSEHLVPRCPIHGDMILFKHPSYPYIDYWCTPCMLDNELIEN